MFHWKSIRMSRQARGLKHVLRVPTGNQAQVLMMGKAKAGKMLREGPGVWETMKQKLRYVVNLPDQPPDFALAPSNPERPVRIHFVTHITMGGIDIYRL